MTEWRALAQALGYPLRVAEADLSRGYVHHLQDTPYSQQQQAAYARKRQRLTRELQDFWKEQP